MNTFIPDKEEKKRVEDVLPSRWFRAKGLVTNTFWDCVHPADTTSGDHSVDYMIGVSDNGGYVVNIPKDSWKNFEVVEIYGKGTLQLRTM